jgi:hypothetical protein
LVKKGLSLMPHRDWGLIYTLPPGIYKSILVQVTKISTGIESNLFCPYKHRKHKIKHKQQEHML